MSRLIVLILLLFWGFRPKAQTVGLVDYTDEVQPGYVLFAPTSTGDVYLIDECGQKVNMWEVDGKAGLMGRLDKSGSLFYTRKQPSSIFNGGGIGGGLITYSWDGELKYIIPLADTDFHQHHDFVILPNGNLLFVGWEYISAEEALAEGRELVNMNGLWTEKIREIEPNNGVEPKVVWEWRVWDHLVQNVDPTKPNFGVIVDNPQRINLNYAGINLEAQDWLHVNALDYNEELDQIVVNCRNFSEFWVIDHSTTTEEAKGSVGGNSGKGGDILYRWGNPQTYDAGDEDDRKLFAQHDAHWIPSDHPDGGKIAVFNNGLGRPDGLWSSVDVIDPILIDGEYSFIGQQFAPLDSEVVYGQPEGQDQFMFSSRISGSQRLRNGNTLICVGQSANFIEVNEEKEIVWDYINPVGIFISTQGEMPNTSNNVFQTIKYYYDFEGFEGKDMTPGEKIELEPLDNCDLILDTEEILMETNIGLKTNIIQSFIDINNPDHLSIEYVIFDSAGKLVAKSPNSFSRDHRIDFGYQNSGMYFITIMSEGKSIYTNKLIKVYE